MKKSLLCLFAVAAMLSACDNGDDLSKTGTEQEWNPGKIEMSTEQRRMVTQNNAFALRMSGLLYEAGDDKSLFFSPVSMAYELGMLLNGADSATSRKILAALCPDMNVSTEELTAFHHTLDAGSAGLDKRTAMETTNALFQVNGGSFLPDFAEAMKQNYQAYVEDVSLSDAEAVQYINRWVSTKTHGRVPAVLKEGTMMSGKVLLLNTIYFKGLWHEPFDAKQTSVQPFLTEAGDRTEVQMMHGKQMMQYAETDAWQAVVLPYGNGSWNMMVVLPRRQDGLKDLLDEQEWPEMSSMQGGTEVDLYLPKFKTETELKELQDVWFSEENIGGLASVPYAFPKMLPAGGESEPHVFHKACIEVDEKGAEAAAVTGDDRYTSVAPVKQAEFRADHPFLYGIVERSTGAIFFLGVFGGE